MGKIVRVSSYFWILIPLAGCCRVTASGLKWKWIKKKIFVTNQENHMRIFIFIFIWISIESESVRCFVISNFPFECYLIIYYFDAKMALEGQIFIFFSNIIQHKSFHLLSNEINYTIDKINWIFFVIRIIEMKTFW